MRWAGQASRMGKISENKFFGIFGQNSCSEERSVDGMAITASYEISAVTA